MLNFDKPNMNFACVYLITCKKNGLKYVGQTINFGHRMQEHSRNVRLGPRSSVWWIRLFWSRDGAKDFSKDYDVTILEYVDETDADKRMERLNEAERRHIISEKVLDKRYGVNTRVGGQGIRGLSNINKRFKAGFKDKAYFAYNCIDGSMILKYNRSELSKLLNIDERIIKDTKVRFQIVKGEYFILGLDYRERSDRAECYYLGALEKLSAMNRVAKKAQYIISLLQNISAYCLSEREIAKHYRYDPAASPNTIAYKSWEDEEVWKERLIYLETLYIQYAASYFQIHSPINSSVFKNNWAGTITNQPVKAYNVIDKTVMFYESLDQFVRLHKLSKHGLYIKMKSGTCIAKNLIVYFIDPELRDAMDSLAHDYCIKHNPSQYYIYTCGLLATRVNGKHLKLHSEPD